MAGTIVSDSELARFVLAERFAKPGEEPLHIVLRRLAQSALSRMPLNKAP